MSGLGKTTPVLFSCFPLGLKDMYIMNKKWHSCLLLWVFARCCWLKQITVLYSCFPLGRQKKKWRSCLCLWMFVRYCWLKGTTGLYSCSPLGRRVKYGAHVMTRALLLLMEDERRSICLGDIKMTITAAPNGRWKEKHLSDCDAEWGKIIGVHFISNSTSVFLCFYCFCCRVSNDTAQW